MPLHLRSTRPSFPSPPPRQGWQRADHCPQSFGPRMTPWPVRVGTPGHRRARSGSSSPSSILLHKPSEMPQECACSSPGRNISPRGVARCGASSKTRSPHEAVSAAIACMATQRSGCSVARPAVLHAGLPFRLCEAASPLLGSMQGQEPPQTPPRRNAANPRRVRYRASFRPGPASLVAR